MLKEKSDIGETRELGDAAVTLEGYQFTAFTPNADEAPRFSSFGNGLVLLTTKFEVEPFKNEESKDISKGKRVTFTLPN